MPLGSKITREYILESQPLKEFFVFENEIRTLAIEAFQNVLDDLKSQERHVQKCLADNPEILVQCLGGGHGRWVIPQKRLGAEFVPDFVIGEKHSGGFFWKAVEIESPRARPFTKKGDPSSPLTHAIRQILDWRSWLTRNQGYAARDRSEQGLGLTDIHGQLPGLVLLGRRENFPESSKELRRQMELANNISIHSFDWLVEVAGARCNHWEGYYESLERIVVPWESKDK